jgi:heparosan-N-sulfate-glucuronate 5-epimerase
MENQLYKILIHFFPKFGNYWDTITECNISQRPNSLGKYYLNFSSKINYAEKFDEFNIPLYYINDKWIYHPTVICQYALGLYEHINNASQNKQELTKKFLGQSDWLVANYNQVDDSAFWWMNYYMEEYNIGSPWCSAIAQGEAISVLLRAHLLTQNDIYIDSASKALKSFLVLIEKKGFRREFDRDSLLFEEYPSQKMNFALNGFIFSLYGLYDFYLFNQNKLAEELFQKGINTLKNSLTNFDLGYWSKYSLYYDPIDYPASYKYHALHVEMLKSLYFITSEKIFQETSIKWEKYLFSFRSKTKSLLKKYYALNSLKS